MKHRNCVYRNIGLGLALLLFTPGFVLSQGDLTERQKEELSKLLLEELMEMVSEGLHGDLNRPADVLLGEAEAKASKADLAALFKQYSEIRGVLGELRGRLGFGDGEEKEVEDRIAEGEQFLTQIESKVRSLCDKLDSSWLLPVDNGPDEAKYGQVVNTVPQVQVTLHSKTGNMLTPTKLALASKTAGSIPFTQVRPGVYIANAPVGEYQLGWQLTNKSIVQRAKVDVAKKGRLVCEITLGPPEIQVKVQLQSLNISSHQSATAENPSPPDATSSAPRSVPREGLLDFTILWDEECLLSYDFFGLRVPSESGETIVFYYGKPDRLPESGPPKLSTMAVIPLRDGEIHGTVRRWSEEGTLLLEVPYHKGKMHGESRFFNRKGQLLGSSTLKQGDGVYRIWDRNQDHPVLLKKLTFLDGNEQSSPGNSTPSQPPGLPQ